MRLLRLLTFVSCLSALACGGSSENEPPPIYVPPEGEDETAQQDTQPEPQQDHGGEAEALHVALALAEAEGHNVADYSDIVVHKNDDQDWVVQLRRPRLHRFLEVVVDHRSGHGELTVRTTGHH